LCDIKRLILLREINTMAKVGIVMGSDSDMPIMAKAADVLEELGIDYEMTIISTRLL
jgi:phosphoribosylcarboxyaminoimidazole (NCAIR) mutase